MANYEDIQNQISSLQARAKEMFNAEKKKAIDQVKALIMKFDMTAAELGFRGGNGRSKKVVRLAPAEYRNPVTGKTWGGRGKRPFWIVEAIAKGNLDDYRVDAKTEAKPAAKKATIKTAKKLTAKPVSRAKTAAKKPVAKTARLAAKSKPAAKKPAAKTKA